MKKILIIVLLLSVHACGQFKFGFTLEGVDAVTTEYHWIFPINAVGLVVGYSPIKKLNIELRASYDSPLFVYYNGANYGVYVSYDFKPLYVIANYTLHSNEGSEDEGVVMKRINYIGIGAGVYLSSVLSFEVIYGRPFKNEPWTWSHDGAWQNIKTQALTGVIKANFKFSWVLN